MLCIFGLFFLIFPPYILVFGVVIKTAYFFIFIPSMIGFRQFVKRLHKNRIMKNVVVSMVVGVFYLVLVSACGFFSDLSAVYQMVLGFIIFFAASFYARLHQNTYGERFILNIFWNLNTAGFIHAVILMLTFLSPEFKDFLYSFISVSDKSMKYLFGDSAGFRFQGIVASGFSFLSTTHALLLVAGVWAYYMEERKRGIFSTLFFISRQLILVVSLILIGRTGFVVLLIFFIMLFLWRGWRKISGLKATGKSVRLLIPSVLLILVGLMSIDLDKYVRNAKFAFEAYFNYLEYGTFSSKSTDQLLQNEYFLPPEFFQKLYGTSNFGRGEDYIFSDVGYVLFIHGAGIIGMIIAFCFYFVGFYYAFRYRKKLGFFSTFMMGFFVMLCILNFKDYYFLDYSGFCQIYFLLVCSLAFYVSSSRPPSAVDQTRRILNESTC